MAIPKEISSKMKPMKGWSNSSDPCKRSLYWKWINMFRRCYDPIIQSKDKNKSYIGCTVNLRWFDMSVFVHDSINLPNFDKAYTDKFEGWALDKDSRVIDNKEYGPDTCMFLTVVENSHERQVRCGYSLSDPEVSKRAHMKQAITRGRPVVAISPDGVATEYYGVSECARQLGCSTAIVHQSCSGARPHTLTRSKIHKGWSFYWKDEYNEDFPIH